jgi:hypothetical protein
MAAGEWGAFMRLLILAMVVLAVLALCPSGARAQDDELWPIFPPYPYRAGHYPKADWYHDMPPYVALKPSFYRKRYFMMAQERNRYRYMPHIFRGYSDGERIDDVDIQSVSGSLKSTYAD